MTFYDNVFSLHYPFLIFPWFSIANISSTNKKISSVVRFVGSYKFFVNFHLNLLIYNLGDGAHLWGGGGWLELALQSNC